MLVIKITTSHRRKVLNKKGTMHYKFEYLHELTFDGREVLLRTRTIKEGKSVGGSLSALETEYLNDAGFMGRIFPGLVFSQFEYDGLPVFEHGENTIYLAHEARVNLSPDVYEI